MVSATVVPLKRPEDPAPLPALPSRAGRLARSIVAAFEAESDRAVLWLPVLLALGIGGYFALPSPPPLVLVHGFAAILVVAALAAPGAWRRRAIWPAVMIAAGAFASAWRVESNHAPVLTRDLGVREIEGTVRWFEPLEAPGRGRLVIEQPRVEGLAPEDTPSRIRLRLQGMEREPAIGDRIKALVALSPPPGEIVPGGYDFARVAWFQGIGAIGYGGGKYTLLAPAGAQTGPAQFFARLRTLIQARIRAVLPGRSGAFAAALTTGARAAMGKEDLVALTNSGLLHILSISGLHLALVAGLAMVGLRGLLALIEPLAVSLPLKKIAAALALGVSAFYVGLSGGDVATWRSFIMLAVAIGAILIDRPALTLRSIAFAAILILVLSPESLFHPSFQMSFGAVTALVAGYEWARARRAARPETAPSPWLRPARFLLAVAATTLLAELATAPFSAYHFNQFVLAGLIANEIAIPLLGFFVMPLAMIAVLAMPLGLEAWPLRALGWGLEQLLEVAHWVAALPRAVTFIEPWPLYALLVVVFGGLWLALWRTRLRWIGAPIAALGVALAILSPGPDLIADADGAIAYRARGGEGWRYGVVGTRAHSFKAEAWVRRLGGDPAGAADAAKGMACDALACLAAAGRGAQFVIVRDGRALAEECAGAQAIIAGAGVDRARCAEPRLVLDPPRLREEGPIAVRFVRGAPRVVAKGAGTGWPWRRPPTVRAKDDSAQGQGEDGEAGDTPDTDDQ